uniref:Uncharacterized protein n=1 Tax=Gouania willdenowi TaxID=441366 RepID=A0A8C5FZD3_GOUWI
KTNAYSIVLILSLFTLSDWPLYSTNMNPFKYLWDVLDHRVSQQIHDLVTSMPQLVQAFLVANGGHTHVLAYNLYW